MIYAKLFALFTHCKSIMYTIKVGDKIIKQTDNPNVAWSSYRANARDYANKQHNVTLLDNDTLLHQKDADRLLLDDVDNVSANDILIFVIKKLGLSLGDAKQSIKDSPLDLSNSRINGWFVAKDKRTHTQMHNDELLVVLDSLLTKTQDAIKTPNNIKKARLQLGLTQSQLAQALGMTPNHLQVSRWEKGTSEMPDSRWQELQKMLNK